MKNHNNFSVPWNMKTTTFIERPIDLLHDSLLYGLQLIFRFLHDDL